MGGPPSGRREEVGLWALNAPGDEAVYLSGFENHPVVLQQKPDGFY